MVGEYLRGQSSSGNHDHGWLDRTLRRLYGFSRYRKLPSESTFSRAFDEFAQSQLAERVHEQLIKGYLGDQLIGYIRRDGTAIAVRERPNKATSVRDIRPWSKLMPKFPDSVIGEAQSDNPPHLPPPAFCEGNTPVNAHLNRIQTGTALQVEVKS